MRRRMILLFCIGSLLSGPAVAGSLRPYVEMDAGMGVATNNGNWAPVILMVEAYSLSLFQGRVGLGLEWQPLANSNWVLGADTHITTHLDVDVNGIVGYCFTEKTTGFTKVGIEQFGYSAFHDRFLSPQVGMGLSYAIRDKLHLVSEVDVQKIGASVWLGLRVDL